MRSTRRAVPRRPVRSRPLSGFGPVFVCTCIALSVVLCTSAPAIAVCRFPAGATGAGTARGRGRKG